MEEQEYWTLHNFYRQVANYFEADLEDTEYLEHGVKPTDIHKQKSEHKEAIRLLSQVLEEDTELNITELESWAENYDDYNEWAGRYGKVSDGGRDTGNWDNPIGK